MDKFCKFCGVEHAATEYPKQCVSCNSTTWVNPTPVAVILQPVYDLAKDRWGILIGERGIQPQKGRYGLPGGFVDVGDVTFEDGALRELLEETGLKGERNALYLSHSYCDGRNGLTFVVSEAGLMLTDLDQFVPNYECPAIRVAWEPEELCFKSHTQALARWFFERQKVSMIAAKMAYGFGDIPPLVVETMYYDIRRIVRDSWNEELALENGK